MTTTVPQQSDSRAPDLTVGEVCWNPAPAPWLSSGRLLALVVEILPTIEDDLAADLVEEFVVLVADRDEQVRATRDVLSAALDSLQVKGKEVERLRSRLIELREALRERSAAN